MVSIYIYRMRFEWHPEKDIENRKQHGIGFEEAKAAFYDSERIIFLDVKHTTSAEKRYFCIGNVTRGICTVRFTVRGDTIRIFGAGLWRKGRKLYEKENSLH